MERAPTLDTVSYRPPRTATRPSPSGPPPTERLRASGSRSGLALDRSLLRDPRHWQIAILWCLIGYGVTFLGLEITATRAIVTMLAALAVQALCSHALRLPRFDARSPLITGSSLTLLLRTSDPFVAAIAAMTAIAAKFVVRIRGKHVFNPANLGLVVAMLLFDDAWVAPGQWGTFAWTALFLVGAGQWVIHRAERSDITWALLGSWALLIFGRAAWLGDPWAIPLHQLGNGALLIFAFFMISDPKTTPDRRATRIALAAIVALVAGWIEFGLYRPAGLIWALVLCAPLVPLMDRLWPAPSYDWPGREAER